MYIKDQDGIISFDLLKTEVNRRKLCRCQNASLILDVNNRLVICDKCGAIMDTFDALLRLGDKQQEWEDYQKKALERKKELDDEAAKYLAESTKNLASMYRYKNTRRIARMCEDGLFPVCPECQKIIDPARINRWSRPGREEHVEDNI